MYTEILLPVDSTPGGVHVSEFVDTFSHLSSKRFSAFFLRDFFSKSEKGKTSPVIEIERLVLESKLESEAKSLNLHFKFLEYENNLQSLIYQSRFADVMIVGPFSAEMAGHFKKVFPEKLLSSINCPLYVLSNSKDNPQEVVFLFDCSLSSLAALKSFITIFGNKYLDVRITVVTVCPENELGVYFEKHLVSYLQSMYKDVGILPMSNQDLMENLITYAANANQPLLIMGHSALQLLGNKSFLKKIAKEEISLFYSNN